jgi:valyl-tRNA synthetase
MHPLAPFITEELWHRLLSEEKVREFPSYASKTVDDRKLFQPSDLLCVQAFPSASDYQYYIDSTAESEMEIVMDCVRAARNLQEKVIKAIGRDTLHGRIVVLQTSVEAKAAILCLRSRIDLIRSVANIGVVDIVSMDDSVKENENDVYLDHAICPGILLRLPLTVKQSEIQRIEAEMEAIARRIERHQRTIAKIQATLTSEHFLRNAPQHVQRKEQERLDDAFANVESLGASLDTLKLLMKA